MAVRQMIRDALAKVVPYKGANNRAIERSALIDYLRESSKLKMDLAQKAQEAFFRNPRAEEAVRTVGLLNKGAGEVLEELANALEKERDAEWQTKSQKMKV